MMTPRKTPCASCPYRRDVPSGVWAASEYDKLPGYDGTTGEQAERGAWGVFCCHNSPGQVCAGWAHLADEDTLALRMDHGTDRRAVIAYRTSVPLWESGAAAAEHGKRDIGHPSEAACQVTGKVIITREAIGIPVSTTEEETP